MINVFGEDCLGSETALPLAGAQAPSWVQFDKFAQGYCGGGVGVLKRGSFVEETGPATLLAHLPLC